MSGSDNVIDNLLTNIHIEQAEQRSYDSLRAEVVQLHRFYTGMLRHKVYIDDWLAHNEAWCATYNRNWLNGPLAQQELRLLVGELNKLYESI